MSEGTRQGESSIARIKRQKREAEDALAAMEAKYDRLESKLEQILQAQGQNSAPRGNENQDKELFNLAFAEAGEVNEDKARYALYKLVENKLEGLKSEILSKTNESVTGILTQQQARNQLAQKVSEIFGQEALKPTSDLHRVAERVVAQQGIKDPTPEQTLLAFYEAKARLDQSSQFIDDGADEGPPPSEAMSQSTGSGTPDYVDVKKAALEEGDTNGAIRAVAAKLGFGS